MPSHLHEALLQLFRNRPELAPELLRALQADLPAYTGVRIDSADLTEIQPAEYRADLVVSLTDDAPILGIVVAHAARVASACLDEDRSVLYVDLILAALSESARRELQIMKPAGYEFQSDFAKHYVAQGRQEGQIQGRAAIVTRLLTLRFGPIADETRQRLAQASISELDDVGERLLTAPTLQDALAPLRP
jgi:hypothetical protein